ncbi:MAG: hypothetical protein JNN00_15415 [Chitinophagaceae bacterium]|nr:hypothetical protein [Chitinophagaceae bacterium]
MLKRKLNRNDLILIAANLIPVYGVWFLGWSAIDAFIVYALETLIVGIMTLLKMLVMTLARGKDLWYNEGSATPVSGLFFMAFFTLHYGLFAAVQTTIFSQSADITPPGSGMMHFFFHWYEYINKDIGYMLAGFVVSYFATSFVPFIVSGEYKKGAMMKVMFQPYGRIFIQQFTVILGSMFLTFGFGKGFILVFAIAKIFFDVYVNFEGIIDKSMKDMEKKNQESNNSHS